uniref:hypothetical protein n=1 Tax=Prevotella sp. TaxID=59823 RepID=UPI00402A591D
MKNLVKGLMLSVAIALGATTAQAQNNGTGTSTEDVKPAAATEFWMGETAKAGEFYLYNVGAKIFATNNTPSETDITNATLWTAKESNKSFSFTGKNGYKIYMHSEFSLGITWTAKIDQNETATDFTLAAGTSTEKGYVYSFSKKEGVFTRYFNIDNKKFTPAKKQSNSNDWLLISDAQKKAYTEYVKLFEKAKSYTKKGSKLFESDDVKKTDAIVIKINDALKSYTYNTYMKDGQAKLNDAIQAAEAFIKNTTGINEIGSTTDAKVSEIYGVNGARKSQLTKGLNIVKMSDGTVKKVLVK